MPSHTPPVNYVVTDENGLETIRPLWIQLNNLHLTRTRDFGDYYQNITFDDRKRDFEVTIVSGGFLRVDIACNGDDGRPVGYCVSSVSGENRGEIESIFVEPSSRSVGIGSALLSRALDWMEMCRPRPVRVKVASGNEDVLGFYARFGFVQRMIVLERKSG